MSSKPYHLSDCGEFRQTLLTRPPLFVHVVWLLAAGLIVAVVVWAALTHVDLVVRAPGRVRPSAGQELSFSEVSGQKLAFPISGRIFLAQGQAGRSVKKGETLAVLDTERVDNDLRHRADAIRAATTDVARLTLQLDLLHDQEAAAIGKAEAELADVQEEIRQARERRLAELRSAEAELERAGADETRQERLYTNGAGSQGEWQSARVKHREAQERVLKARLPIEDTKARGLEQAVAGTRKDFALRHKELETRRTQRTTELETLRVEVANLELERRHHTLAAPFDGIVTWAEARPGDVVPVGKHVVAVADAERIRIDLAIPSRDIGDVRVGLPVKVRIDAFDHQRFGTLDGTIVALAPDAQFQEARNGSNGAAVYIARIEVPTAEVGRGECRGEARIGMTGQGEIVTGRERLVTVLLRKIRQGISLS